MITFELFEDSGINIGGRGAITTPVQSCGFYNVPTPESDQYYLFPIIRPNGVDEFYSASFTKWYYAKITTGDWYAKNPSIVFKGNFSSIADFDTTVKTRLYYKTTNIYEPQTNLLLNGRFHQSETTLLFGTSLTGPNDAYYHNRYLMPNTVYYTNYVVMQLYAEPGEYTDYGNIGDLQMMFVCDEVPEVL